MEGGGWRVEDAARQVATLGTYGVPRKEGTRNIGKCQVGKWQVHSEAEPRLPLRLPMQ